MSLIEKIYDEISRAGSFISRKFAINENQLDEKKVEDSFKIIKLQYLDNNIENKEKKQNFEIKSTLVSFLFIKVLIKSSYLKENYFQQSNMDNEFVENLILDFLKSDYKKIIPLLISISVNEFEYSKESLLFLRFIDETIKNNKISLRVTDLIDKAISIKKKSDIIKEFQLIFYIFLNFYYSWISSKYSKTLKIEKINYDNICIPLIKLLDRLYKDNEIFNEISLEKDGSIITNLSEIKSNCNRESILKFTYSTLKMIKEISELSFNTNHEFDMIKVELFSMEDLLDVEKLKDEFLKYKNKYCNYKINFSSFFKINRELIVFFNDLDLNPNDKDAFFQNLIKLNKCLEFKEYVSFEISDESIILNLAQMKNEIDSICSRFNHIKNQSNISKLQINSYNNAFAKFNRKNEQLKEVYGLFPFLKDYSVGFLREFSYALSVSECICRGDLKLSVEKSLYEEFFSKGISFIPFVGDIFSKAFDFASEYVNKQSLTIQSKNLSLFAVNSKYFNNIAEYVINNIVFDPKCIISIENYSNTEANLVLQRLKDLALIIEDYKKDIEDMILKDYSRKMSKYEVLGHMDGKYLISKFLMSGKIHEFSEEEKLEKFTEICKDYVGKEWQSRIPINENPDLHFKKVELKLKRITNPNCSCCIIM